MSFCTSLYLRACKLDLISAAKSFPGQLGCKIIFGYKLYGSNELSVIHETKKGTIRKYLIVFCLLIYPTLLMSNNLHYFTSFLPCYLVLLADSLPYSIIWSQFPPSFNPIPIPLLFLFFSIFLRCLPPSLSKLIALASHMNEQVTRSEHMDKTKSDWMSAEM